MYGINGVNRPKSCIGTYNFGPKAMVRAIVLGRVISLAAVAGPVIIGM